MNLRALFRLSAIIGTLPVTLTNGTTADATQVMSDLNWIVNQVNANAAPLSGVALLASANTFTAVQSGIAAAAAANFPIASQVQNWAFNTLTSTLGTNTITARVAVMAPSAYAEGQVFTFIPSQTNTGPSSLNVNSLGSAIIYSGGATLVGYEMEMGVPQQVMRSNSVFNLLAAPSRTVSFMPFLISDADGSATYSQQDGELTRTGSRYDFSINMTLTGLGSLGPGNISMAGFPRSNARSAVAISAANLGSNVNSVQAVLGSMTIRLHKFQGGARAQLIGSDITSTSIFHLAGTYRAES